MCARYNIIDSAEVRLLLNLLAIELGLLPDRYNIAPTEPALAIVATDNGYAAMDMRWWLCPSWSDGPSQQFAMFNARSETIDTSKAYRGPFKHHRAVMPATSFIEWSAWMDKDQDIDTLKMLMGPNLAVPLEAVAVDKTIGDSRVKKAPKPISIGSTTLT